MNCSCGKSFHPAESFAASVHKCEGCGNLLVSTESLAQITDSLIRRYTPAELEDLRAQCRERMENLVSGSVRAETRLYHDCPVCAKTMSRRSFAPGSGIVVHQCPQHGLLGAFNWLKQAVEFIEKGGEYLVLKDELETAQARIRELQGQRDSGHARGSFVYIPT